MPDPIHESRTPYVLGAPLAPAPRLGLPYAYACGNGEVICPVCGHRIADTGERDGFATRTGYAAHHADAHPDAHDAVLTMTEMARIAEAGR